MNLDIQFYSFRWIDRNGTRAIQSLSRSTYSKLLPETEDHTTYFSFFDVTEKYLIVLGTFWSIHGLNAKFFFILAVFLLGFIVLSFMKILKKVK
jgi:UMF1 family MFS transporter